ncbi:MAG: hypothetical protein Q8O61_11040 [Nocardioides sp.]|nr:hypothetical protein [Nocardioides sp.]
MEINGLPLHALVIHAAVVLGPLAALTGLLYALVPRWRDRLRWPLVAMAAVGAVAIWVSYLSGEELAEANTYGGPLEPLVETHEDRAGILRLSMTAFAVLSFLAAWWHTRTGAVRAVMSGLVAVSAVVTLVYVVLTGDAGAQIAWYGVEG